jgi:hypothetical protein
MGKYCGNPDSTDQTKRRAFGGPSVKDATSEEDAAASPGRALSLSAWCIVAAFGTYFCMYAFRKPFTAGSYAETSLGDAGYKSILVTAQVLG